MLTSGFRQTLFDQFSHKNTLFLHFGWITSLIKPSTSWLKHLFTHLIFISGIKGLQLWFNFKILCWIMTFKLNPESWSISIFPQPWTTCKVISNMLTIGKQHKAVRLLPRYQVRHFSVVVKHSHRCSLVHFIIRDLGRASWKTPDCFL